MIISFCHEGLKLLYDKGVRKRIQPEYIDKIERILARLDEATEPANMDLPGFRLHPLKGGPCGLLVGQCVRQLAHRLSFGNYIEKCHSPLTFVALSCKFICRRLRRNGTQSTR